MAILAAIVRVSCRGEDRMTRQEFLDAGNRVCAEQSRKQEVAVNARDDLPRAIRGPKM